MKNKFALLVFSAQKINRQHVQLVLVIVSLAMLVLGIGAPADGGGVGQISDLVTGAGSRAVGWVGLGALARAIRIRSPNSQHLWLVFVAFLPQFIVVYLPNTRRLFPDWLAAGLLLASQILLLAFAWLNRRISGMAILLCGVVLNLVVMTANGGFMPISPQTASRLVSEDSIAGFPTWKPIRRKRYSPATHRIPASNGWRIVSCPQPGSRTKWLSASATFLSPLAYFGCLPNQDHPCNL